MVATTLIILTYYFALLPATHCTSPPPQLNMLVKELNEILASENTEVVDPSVNDSSISYQILQIFALFGRFAYSDQYPISEKSPPMLSQYSKLLPK